MPIIFIMLRCIIFANTTVFIYELGQKVQKSSAQARARSVLSDRRKLDEQLRKCREKVRSVPGFEGIADGIFDVIDMVRDYKNGSYKEIPLRTIVAATSMIVYLVSPVDLMPDFVPIAGQADDIAIVTIALKVMHDDLEDYRKWKSDRFRKAASETATSSGKIIGEAARRGASKIDNDLRTDFKVLPKKQSTTRPTTRPENRLENSIVNGPGNTSVPRQTNKPQTKNTNSILNGLSDDI